MIGNGHEYRIIVSDLDQGRAIWVGGRGRKEEDFDLLFAMLGEKKTARIELAVMDMWRPFRNSLMHLTQEPATEPPSGSPLSCFIRRQSPRAGRLGRTSAVPVPLFPFFNLTKLLAQAHRFSQSG